MAGHTELGAWTADGGTVRLRAIPFEAHLPPGLHVDHSVILLWTLESHAELPELTLACEFGTDVLTSGPASGQGLDALSWWTGEMELSLGTYDCESLRARARMQAVPARWIAGFSEATVCYLPAGLGMTLPSMTAAERAILHMAVAWVRGGDPEAARTWFAVDVPFAQLDAVAQ